MTAKSNTHGPAENQMSTGFTLDGFPSIGLVGQLRARQREPGPAGVRRDPRPARRAAGRARTTGAAASCPPSSRAPPFNADKPIPNLATPDGDRRRRRRGDARLPASCSTSGTWRSTPATPSWPRASPATNWPRGCSSARAEVGDLSQGDRGDAASSTAPTTRTSSRPASPATACSPGGCSSAACGSCSSSTAPTRWARASATGTATRRSRTQYDVHAPDPRPARAPRCSAT